MHHAMGGEILSSSAGRTIEQQVRISTWHYAQQHCGTENNAFYQQMPAWCVTSTVMAGMRCHTFVLVDHV